MSEINFEAMTEEQVDEQRERMMADFGPEETGWIVEIDYLGREKQIILAPTKDDAHCRAIENFEAKNPGLVVNGIYAERIKKGEK